MVVTKKFENSFGKKQIMEKEENAGYQHFLLFPHFPEVSTSGLLKVDIVGKV